MGRLKRFGIVFVFVFAYRENYSISLKAPAEAVFENSKHHFGVFWICFPRNVFKDSLSDEFYVFSGKGRKNERMQVYQSAQNCQKECKREPKLLLLHQNDYILRHLWFIYRENDCGVHSSFTCRISCNNQVFTTPFDATLSWLLANGTLIHWTFKTHTSKMNARFTFGKVLKTRLCLLSYKDTFRGS